MVLLDVLALLSPALGVRLTVLHVDHGLRPEHDAEAAFARRAAAAHGLPIHVIAVSIPRDDRGHASEARCRAARLAAYRRARALLRADRIATGHTLDDQVETVLLRLGRGAGPAGLGGIVPRRRFEDGLLIVRPLLHEPRAAIAEYAASQELGWCEDASNRDPRYLRNRVRHELLPVMEDLFGPAVRNHVAAAAAHIAEEHAALETLLLAGEGRLFHTLNPSSGAETGSAPVTVTVDLDALAEVPAGAHAPLFRLLLQRLGVAQGIYATHLEAVTALTQDRAGSAEVHLPGGFRVARTYDTLSLSRRTSAAGEGSEPGDVAVTLAGPGRVRHGALTLVAELAPSTTAGSSTVIAADPSPFPLRLRRPRPGERVALSGGGHRAIARILIDRKVPRALRPEVLVVTDGDDRVIWLIAPTGMNLEGPPFSSGGGTGPAWTSVYRTGFARPAPGARPVVVLSLWN
jgi:tRNA(Ile)-lysidine synthase